MKRYTTLFNLVGVILLLLSISYVHAQDKDDEVGQEETCSLDPSKASDCATADEAATSTDELLTTYTNVQDLTRQVIPLTDETFDELTWTSEPSTWIIMFKTDSCGLCKKAKPILESLAVDADIIKHNDEQMKDEVGGNIEDGSTEEVGGEDQPPKGLIYVATIDAGSWASRDITKRFEVDGTPHMILIRNEGYTDVKEESRSYYVYRGQRALYPLRRFVFGEFASRKQLEMPPPLSQEERKKSGFVGRLYDFLLLPSVKWAGTIVGKIILAWVVFISLLGLFMRVHNYAWGENDDDDDDHYNKEKEAIEKEKAKGRAEFEEDKDEKAKRRQQIMWERKRANHEKRKKKEAAATSSSGKDDGDDDADDDDFQGVGKVVTRSAAMKAKAGTKQKKK
jgi:thioredoxin-related protein